MDSFRNLLVVKSRFRSALRAFPFPFCFLFHLLKLSENDPPSIYFATDEGVQRYSLDAGDVKTVADSSEGIYGVAFDWLRDKVYWNSLNKVFRANRNGTGVETILDTPQCKSKLSSFENPFGCEIFVLISYLQMDFFVDWHWIGSLVTFTLRPRLVLYWRAMENQQRHLPAAKSSQDKVIFKELLWIQSQGKPSL